MSEVKGRVIYLNRWLDCPDTILRRNYSMQEKITYARNHFFYKLREEGASEERMKFLYGIWVQKNRKRIKVVEYEDDIIHDPNDSNNLL